MLDLDGALQGSVEAMQALADMISTRGGGALSILDIQVKMRRHEKNGLTDMHCGPRGEPSRSRHMWSLGASRCRRGQMHAMMAGPSRCPCMHPVAICPATHFYLPHDFCRDLRIAE